MLTPRRELWPLAWSSHPIQDKTCPQDLRIDEKSHRHCTRLGKGGVRLNKGGLRLRKGGVRLNKGGIRFIIIIIIFIIIIIIIIIM